MGIVKRQGFMFSIISYAGIAIGALNVLFLVPRLMGMQNYGILNLIIAISIIYAQAAQIGIPQIVMKYLPEFRSEDKKHSGFITWLGLLGTISFVFFSLLFLVFKGLIVAFFAGHSSDFLHFYFQIIPLSLFTILYSVLDTLARSLFKSVLSSFLNEVVSKLVTSVGIVLFYFKVIDFDNFIDLYIYSTGLICLIVIWQLYRANEFKMESFKGKISRAKSREMLLYGFYNLLAGSTFVLVQKLDLTMLAHFIGEAVVGVYGTYIYISSVMTIPSKSINRLAYVLVADSFVKKDMEAIDAVYRRTSIIQMLLGCFIFAGIILNRETMLEILNKPIFRTEFTAFYWLGLAILVDSTGGLNTYIVAISHKFRISTLILVCSFLVCLALNYLLIPRFGSTGAALALLGANCFLNFSTWLYLKIRFNLQPFNWKHLLLVLITLATLAIISLLPRLPNLVADVCVRSSLITVLYGALIYVCKISEDINQQLRLVFSKVFRSAA